VTALLASLNHTQRITTLSARGKTLVVQGTSLSKRNMCQRGKNNFSFHQQNVAVVFQPPKQRANVSLLSTHASCANSISNRDIVPQPKQTKTMQVETYEVELVPQDEMQSLAADGEHAMLIESLGLTGQRKLIGGEDIKPFPYRIMTQEEQRVFQFLFPQQTKLEDYSSELIPLRVLQVASHAKSTGFLDKGLFVWSPKDSQVDPVLLGKASIPESSWGERIYLLARWGSVLLPFEKLVAQAKAKWKTLRKAELQKAIAEVSALANTFDADGDRYFLGEHVTTSVSF
jgi:hypothetical protein